jgi:hypothetical protein
MELEKKMDRLNNHKTSFFRPFNSVFERDMHLMNKQKNYFNNNAGMNP